MEVFAIAALGLAFLSVCFLVVLIVRRLILARSDRQRAERQEQLRPQALAIVHGDPVSLSDRIHSHVDATLFAELLSRYARQLRGGSIERIAEFFERRGDVAEEVTHLRARRPWRRASAAYALGDMGSASATPDLLRLLVEDDDRDVRNAAARSLGRLGATEAVPALVDALVRTRIPRALAGQALAEIGPASAPILVGLLEHDEPPIRAWAAELVGLLGSAGDAAAVSLRLKDTSAEVRERSARALGRLGASSEAGALREALADRVPGVRAAAAFGLGRLRDRSAVPALLAQANTDAFEPAQSAAHALSRIDERALLEAAERPDAGPHLLEAADLAAL